jgi:hypothetical protein
MWVLSERGFISAVRHRDNPGLLLVRARDAQSLAAFCSQAGVDPEVITLPVADYKFRVVVEEDALVTFLKRSVREIRYTNFKAQVQKTRGTRWHDVLVDAWRVLRRLQD